MTEPLSMWRRMFGSRDVASCRQAGALMQSVLDGEADAATQAQVLRHLDACRRCGMEADTYRAIKASVVAQCPVEVDPQAVADLEAFARTLTEQP